MSYADIVSGRARPRPQDPPLRNSQPLSATTAEQQYNLAALSSQVTSQDVAQQQNNPSTPRAHATSPVPVALPLPLAPQQQNALPAPEAQPTTAIEPPQESNPLASEKLSALLTAPRDEPPGEAFKICVVLIDGITFPVSPNPPAQA